MASRRESTPSTTEVEMELQGRSGMPAGANESERRLPSASNADSTDHMSRDVAKRMFLMNLKDSVVGWNASADGPR